MLSGGPESTVRGRRAADRRRGVRTAACRCSGSATACRRSRSSSAAASSRRDQREFGYAAVKLAGSDPLLDGPRDATGAELDVWMSHGDRVDELPPGFEAIASTASAPIAAMADVKRKIYGVQFHPEVTHTEHGSRDHPPVRARHLRLRAELDARRTSSPSDRTRCARRSATDGCCSACRAASTRRSSRRCCTRAIGDS